MDSDDVADTLADRQVVKLVCEEDYSREVDDSLSINSAGGICDFESSQILLGLVRLVGEGGVEDDCVKIDVFADLAL